jgi:hypothetical protein
MDRERAARWSYPTVRFLIVVHSRPNGSCSLIRSKPRRSFTAATATLWSQVADGDEPAVTRLGIKAANTAPMTIKAGASPHKCRMCRMSAID